MKYPWWIWCSSLVVAGCEADFEVLQLEQGNSQVVATCGGDVEGAITFDERALSCLGYRCAGTDDYAPGSSECLSAATNAAQGTCVDTFFDCFRPTGACTASNDGSAGLNWADGSKLRVQEFSNGQRAFIPAGDTEPCILEDDYNDGDPTSVLARQH